GLVDGYGDNAADDRVLIEDILKLLAKDRVDYTIFWRRLSHSASGTSTQGVRDLFLDRAAADGWLLRYSERLAHNPRGLVADLMLKTNPKFVLRNHLGEQAIKAAKLKDFSQVDILLTLLESPFDEHPGYDDYADFPPDWAASI
ncbi:MAG: protein adenylyltransferase SelO family protein, partial [Rhodoferax sp.]|nr:protein adenylyltransferase SelO family protein [Rhodoferax sp.]